MTVQDKAESFIIVGQLGKTYGVAGWLKVNSFTSPFDNILDYHPWYYQQDEQWVVLPIIDKQLQGNYIIAHVENMHSPEAARRITGTDIAIKRSQLPKLAKDENFWCDLVGLNVVTTTGLALGTVARLFDSGANDVLVIQGEKEHLIPYIKDHFILQVNLAERVITVDWDPDF